MSKHQVCGCAVAVLLLIATHSTPARPAGQGGTEKPCHDQPALVGKCFAVRGRLSLYNGTPTVRLWKAGTKRVLGVSGSYAQAGYSSIPAELEQQLSWEMELWGEYLVCPFTRRRPGEMQLVCIDKAKKVVSRRRR
jgi:hypothetical protein